MIDFISDIIKSISLLPEGFQKTYIIFGLCYILVFCLYLFCGMCCVLKMVISEIHTKYKKEPVYPCPSWVVIKKKENI